MPWCNVRQSGARRGRPISPARFSRSRTSAPPIRNGFKVLHNVSVHVPKGQTLAVVGRIAARAKSTLARVITGLLPPSEGRVTVRRQSRCRRRLKNRPNDDLRRIQMIYQMADTAMNPRQTVRDIIGRPLTFYYGLHGGPEDGAGEGTARPDRDGQRLHRPLPGRTFRRPEAARARSPGALAAKPELILCDEPTSALDPLVAEGILKLLLRLQEENAALLHLHHPRYRHRQGRSPIASP